MTWIKDGDRIPDPTTGKEDHRQKIDRDAANGGILECGGMGGMGGMMGGAPKKKKGKSQAELAREAEEERERLKGVLQRQIR